jgi:hypothetical protein
MLGQIASVLEKHVVDLGHDGHGLEQTQAMLLHMRKLSGSIARTEADPLVKSVARSVVRIATRNIKRLDGRIQDGYNRFPDYGELGEAATSLRLLATLLDGSTRLGEAKATANSGVISW